MTTAYESAVRAFRDGDLARAAEGFAESLEEQPIAANYNLGQALRGLGRLGDAEAAYGRVLALQPGHREASYRLGEIYLATGRFAEGWPLYEMRRGVDPTTMEPTAAWPELSCPEWRGEDVAGKHVLVFGEQGYGDRIMFARFLRSLRQAGATCSFICRAELAGLFAEAWASTLPLPTGHFWTMTCALPARLNAGAPPAPYPIRPTLQRPCSRRVGVIPTGNPGHFNNGHRSLFGPDAAALLEMGMDLRPEATGARSFVETAEIIAGLDLVISVDTSTAHLAASMGKPTWVLLPCIGTDWRWMRNRDDSPWYPSARLFRQTSPGGWADVLDRVRHELRA